MTKGDALLLPIEQAPGRTAAERAAAILGNDGCQQPVNSDGMG